VQATVRRFVKERYLPRAAELFAKEQFASDLIPELAELGLLGASLTGLRLRGHERRQPTAWRSQELEYGDSGLRSFASASRAPSSMYPIWKYGSEEQKQRFLPQMATGELIGCFGLTEPDAAAIRQR
jgi:glutaryl-CoA dehydrogenase